MHLLIVLVSACFQATRREHRPLPTHPASLVQLHDRRVYGRLVYPLPAERLQHLPLPEERRKHTILPVGAGQVSGANSKVCVRSAKEEVKRRLATEL